MDWDVGIAAWVRDCLVIGSKFGLPVGVWRRRRIDAAVVFFQFLSNARGRYDLFLVEPFRGRRSTILFSKGLKGKGWVTMVGEFSGFFVALVASKGRKDDS